VNQLYVYLVSVAVLFLAGWILMRRFIRRDHLQKGQLSRLTTTILTLYFFAYGGFPIIYLPNYWPRSIAPMGLRVCGTILVYVGIGILLYGMFRLGILASMGQGRNTLKQTGFYKYTRNPQTIGLWLYVIGFTILWPSWYALGWALISIPILHGMILTEEEHLLHRYGEEYELYCERVPRYVGFRKKK
jgi:protein-S-isoprenylcysteine O-methyltransferase Ste14